jgi:hypothetical protein
MLKIFGESINRSVIAQKRKSSSLFALNPEQLAKHRH